MDVDPVGIELWSETASNDRTELPNYRSIDTITPQSPDKGSVQHVLSSKILFVSCLFVRVD